MVTYIVLALSVIALYMTYIDKVVRICVVILFLIAGFLVLYHVNRVKQTALSIYILFIRHISIHNEIAQMLI
jgi:hypothetical protein